jgi:hypothetical protein
MLHNTLHMLQSKRNVHFTCYKKHTLHMLQGIGNTHWLLETSKYCCATYNIQCCIKLLTQAIVTTCQMLQ